jgi:acyl dehydratase
LTIGTSVDVPFVVSRIDMDTFSRLSGDANPIHMDDEFASGIGFKGPVVFGALIVAKISMMLGMYLPGPGSVWAGLKIDFRNPLYIGESAILHGEVDHASPATGMLSLKLSVRVGDRLIATASAESVFKP